MDFSDERYVRLYTRNTATWGLLEWEGRFTFMTLLRMVSRAGVFDFGAEGPVIAIATVGQLPQHIAQIGLANMVTQGVVTIGEQSLVIDKFIEAQEAPMSSRLRQEESRARRADQRDKVIRDGLAVTNRDQKLSSEDAHGGGPETRPTNQSVTKRDARPVTKRDTVIPIGHSEPYPPVESQNVTKSSKMSQNLTPSQTVQNLTVPILPVSHIPVSQSVRRATPDGRTDAVDSTPKLSSELPPRPARRPDQLVDQKIHVTAWQPLPEAEAYGAALGLSPQEYGTTLLELRSKVRPDKGYPNLFDDRLYVFLEAASRRRTERARAPARPAAVKLVPGPIDPSRLSAEEREFYDECLKLAEVSK
jgi:hypothetical protein